ncbi:MAG: AraC family transcriptional regulator [Myxococcales bacterium]|nr:AraC family transcriptional regulator [Myxococcales bacterium]
MLWLSGMAGRGKTAGTEELRRLIARRAPGEGRTASVLPGLWFFRFSSPYPPKTARTTAMYLAVAVSGAKHVQVSGEHLVYDRLSYLVLRGETEYAAAPVEATPDEPYLSLGMLLPPEVVLRTLLEVSEHGGVRESLPDARAFVSPLEGPLVDALCRLLRTLDSPLERQVLAPLIQREIVFRLLETDAAAVLRQAVREPERERIREAMNFIEANVCQRLSVESIAKQVAMSPSHFAHRFKEIASVSPMRFQKHLRLERARELLLANGSTAGHVAAEVGYASPAQFTRDFKRQFGLAPGHYARTFEVAPTVHLDGGED